MTCLAGRWDAVTQYLTAQTRSVRSSFRWRPAVLTSMPLKLAASAGDSARPMSSSPEYARGYEEVICRCGGDRKTMASPGRLFEDRYAASPRRSFAPIDGLRTA